MPRLGGLFALLCALSLPDDEPSLASAPWVTFKEGSWVKTKFVTKLDGKVDSSYEMKQLVKAVGKDEVVIETDTREGDKASEKTEDKISRKEKVESSFEVVDFEAK